MTYIKKSNICNHSNTYIKLLTQDTKKKSHKKSHTTSSDSSSYTKYKKYISTLSNQFIISQNTLLTSLFKIKNDTHFTITYKELSLEDTTLDASINKYKIPKFIDIFRYLISIPDFNNKFTLEEQTLLKHKLSNKYSKSQCYTFLDTSTVGTKFLSVYNNLEFNDLIMVNLNLNYPSLTFHKLLINSFTSYKILEDLELNIKSLILYSIVYEGQTLNNFVYLFRYDNDKTQHHSTTILDLGKDIIKRILFFNTFLNNKLYPDKFIIFLTNNKKEIDKELREHIHFKTINVNTAVTNGHDIIIYREQELLKSIFHELIHFHNLDFRHISPHILNNIINYLINTHNIKSNNEYLLYECITETLANILNNIYYSKTLNEMSINLQHEIMFSTLQISKILHICKYKKWNQFTYMNTKHSATSNPAKDISKQFKQDSCVFSYYILKLYIFLNLDTYFKQVLDHKMKFIQTKKSFDILIHIFDSSRKNIVLEQIMNSILKGLNKKTKDSKEIHHTLRMTCL